jgi:cellulose biosynthesis protein BcsQ
MLSEMGIPVVVADFDPQANLTSAFLADERLEEIWGAPEFRTAAGSIQPLIEREGDLLSPTVEMIGEHIGLIVGDLVLSRYEDSFSEVWPKCLSRDIGAFRVTSAFHRLVRLAATEIGAKLVLIDVGPNLGAINRAALIACDEVVMPLGADLFSLRGLRNVGPALRGWRDDWRDRLDRRPTPSLDLPAGTMSALGYVVMRHSVRLDRPARAFGRWMARIPLEYNESVRSDIPWADTVEDDPWCLGLLKDFRSLMPLAQEARKPMFLLKPADGAFGGHQRAVQECYREFRKLTERLLRECKLGY